MSDQQNNQLRAGEYYGSVVRRRQLSGLVLSELKHAQPRALPQHSHEFGFFSFLLKGDYEESVWDHLAGTISAPFAAGEHGQVAVKVIDQRGNELLVVKSLKEAGK